MKNKLLTFLGALMLLVALAIPVSAAEEVAEIDGFTFKPTGEVIEVVTTGDIRMRDQKYGNPEWVPKGTTLWLIGESCTWEDRGFVLWEAEEKLGTVLEGYLEPTGRKFTYTGTGLCKATTQTRGGLRLRDSEYNALQLVPTNTPVYEFGQSVEWPGRTVVLAQHTMATVLKGYTKRDTSTAGSGKEEQDNPAGEGSQSQQDEWFIVSKAEFNFRKETSSGQQGALLHPEALPEGTVFRIEGECPADPTRWRASLGHVKGTIMKSSNQRKLTAIPYKKIATPYAATTNSGSVLLAGDGKTVIDEIPEYGIFTIYGTSKDHPSCWFASFQGNTGLVPMNDTWRVGDCLYVDIETQTTTLFKDGKWVVVAKCVTGQKGKNGSATEHGKFHVNVMWEDYTMNGVNNNGEPYALKVKKFIAFNGETAFHDAWWRDDSEFGGSTYKTDGSLECVNCPLWYMEKIYPQTKCGMTVQVIDEPQYY